MKKILFSSALIVSSLLSVKAQEISAVTPSPDYKYAAPGTYQFIFHPCKFKYVFTRETLIEIEKKRDAEIDQIVPLNPCVEVLIPSRKKILAKGFVPLDEMKEISD